MKSHVALLLVAFAPVIVSGFVGQNAPRSFVGASSTSLSVGPLQKLTNKKEYEKTVQGLMQTKGYTREQAEKEYNKYLENPTNYALEKVCIMFTCVDEKIRRRPGKDTEEFSTYSRCYAARTD